MANVLFIFILFSNLLTLSLSFPLCTDSRAPTTLNTTLQFCPNYNGKTCCNSTEDLQLQEQFMSMNISDPSCASLMQSILCAKCDPFSWELYRNDSVPRQAPVLCNSTISATSSQSSQAAQSFCLHRWNVCQNASISNSPFAPAGQNSTILGEQWQSSTDFCNVHGGASLDGGACFPGEPVILNKTETLTPPTGLCLEKIGNGSYLNMVSHPDGSDRAYFADRQGKIWLATIPAQGSGGTLGLNESNPFADMTDRVHYTTTFGGMLGLAFHSNFTQNGRFFASYTCDSVKWADCTGQCACNADVNCDPSMLPSTNGSLPCQYQSIISEYYANGTSANPVEVKRILSVGLPYNFHPGGQILLGPRDKYLYAMLGDGGGEDPYNLAQNEKSLLGKVLRIDIDKMHSVDENLTVWGNYSIPMDNPYIDNNGMLPEIWALGLRNPWRCSFDSERPSYFICGDVGTDVYEEVDIISKDGNYGWRVYEGPYLYTPQESPGGNTSADSINPIFPILGYHHSEVNNNSGAGAIIGGYFYRSMTDACMYRRYLYADLYDRTIWAAIENPRSSGNFTTSKIPFTCANDSPIPCDYDSGSSLPALGYVHSFGEDNYKDHFILTTTGVYRVVPPSRCNYTCSMT